MSKLGIIQMRTLVAVVALAGAFVTSERARAAQAVAGEAAVASAPAVEAEVAAPTAQASAPEEPVAPPPDAAAAVTAPAAAIESGPMPANLQRDEAGAREPVEAVMSKCAVGDNTKQPFCLMRCADKDVICVNESGSAIPSEIVPSKLEPNTTIQIVVITLAKLPKVRLSETLGGTSFLRLSTSELQDTLALGAYKVAGVAYKVGTVSYTMARDATSERFDFVDDETVIGSLSIGSSGGYYFLSVGAAGIAQFSGTPKIRELTPPAGSGIRYESTRGNELRLGLMLNVHPWGHRAQSLSPFADLPIGHQLSTVLRDLFSLQAGVNLDPTRLTESLLLGVGLEPATGITASFGTLFDTGERFRNGYAPGAFTSPSRDDAVEKFLHTSAYFGITINQRVYELITGAYSAFVGQSQGG